MEHADIEEATALVRWLLQRGVDGLRLTKTHALQRAVVREVAERWPQWWSYHAPPHRESDLRVLAETHAGLRRMRLMRRHPQPLTFELTAAGRQLAASEPAAPGASPAAPGDAALVFDAELVNVRGVRARLAVLERQPLTALHDAIQQAFGWWDDHLYSFWLDGRFWGSDEAEFTSPITPDHGVATADVPIAELDLRAGRRIAYVFDFGDEWRVRLTVRERVAAEPCDHPHVLELNGTPPPQYAGLDD